MNATPTALPSAEDALREAFEQFHAAHFFEHFAAQPLYRRELAVLAFNAGFNAALQSPRASDEVPGEASGASLHDMQITSDSPVPVDASGTLVERWQHLKRGTVYEVLGHAELQDAKGSGVLEGAMLTIYRGEDGMLWAREHSEFHDGRFVNLSHTAPVADAQAGEGSDG